MKEGRPKRKGHECERVTRAEEEGDAADGSRTERTAEERKVAALPPKTSLAAANQYQYIRQRKGEA